MIFKWFSIISKTFVDQIYISNVSQIRGYATIQRIHELLSIIYFFSQVDDEFKTENVRERLSFSIHCLREQFSRDTLDSFFSRIDSKPPRGKVLI